jgi:histone H2A
MPVGRIARLIRDGRYAERVSKTTPVFIASVLEYLTAELVELAGSAAKDSNKKRITPRYINLAVRSDDEFGTLLHGAVIAGGGVQPHINKSLLKKGKSGKKSRRSSSKSSKPAKAKKAKKSKKEKKSKKSKKEKKTQEA